MLFRSWLELVIEFSNSGLIDYDYWMVEVVFLESSSVPGFHSGTPYGVRFVNASSSY